jgi:hypothetical protein
MQEARRALTYSEASRKVAGNDIFEGESGVILGYFIEWPELEEFMYLAIRADACKVPHEFARNSYRRPRALLLHYEE